MNNYNYFHNLEVIAQGKGSSQARYEDELNWGEEGELDIDGYLEYLARKANNDHRP